MSQILDLNAYRNRLAEERSFGPWQKRFGESYGAQTRVADLSDTTLCFLARPGEAAAVAYYELIMGFLDLGKAAKFSYLDKRDQLRVVDRHLFLADQVRFELMRRLGWLTRFPGQGYSFLEMIGNLETVRAETREESATLAESHPDYQAYSELSMGEKQVFLRRRLLKALEEFRPRLPK